MSQEADAPLVRISISARVVIWINGRLLLGVDPNNLRRLNRRELWPIGGGIAPDLPTLEYLVAQYGATEFEVDTEGKVDLRFKVPVNQLQPLINNWVNVIDFNPLETARQELFEEAEREYQLPPGIVEHIRFYDNPRRNDEWRFDWSYVPGQRLEKVLSRCIDFICRADASIVAAEIVAIADTPDAMVELVRPEQIMLGYSSRSFIPQDLVYLI